MVLAARATDAKMVSRTFMPHERLGILVVTINVFPYGLLQLSNAGVGAALDPLLADLAKETLDQIEPGR